MKEWLIYCGSSSAAECLVANEKVAGAKPVSRSYFMKYQNLHTHTVLSDGQLSPIETLKVCEKYGVDAVAFTDHDSLPTEKAVSGLKKYSGPVKWISGIEISSGLPRELGGKPTSNFHIVGLFIDPSNRVLREYCKKMQAARLERMEKIVKNLKSLSFEITTTDCLKESKGETVNRSHIVSALEKKKKNRDIIAKLKAKMRQESKHNEELKKKYLDMERKGEKQVPYSLFLDTGAFIPDIFVDYLYGLPFDETARIIRKAGGLAFLAHWTFIKKIIGFDLVEKLLKERRLDGVEIVYNPNKRQGMRSEILKDMKRMKNLAEKYDCLQSGGADSHSEKDIIDFFQDKEFSEKTIGLAEKMLKHKPNLDNERHNVII